MRHLPHTYSVKVHAHVLGVYTDTDTGTDRMERTKQNKVHADRTRKNREDDKHTNRKHKTHTHTQSRPYEWDYVCV